MRTRGLGGIDNLDWRVIIKENCFLAFSESSPMKTLTTRESHSLGIFLGGLILLWLFMLSFTRSIDDFVSSSIWPLMTTAALACILGFFSTSWWSAAVGFSLPAFILLIWSVWQSLSLALGISWGLMPFAALILLAFVGAAVGKSSRAAPPV